jgi:hypothetical protein
MQQLTRMILELTTELIQATEKANAAGKVKNLNVFIAVASQTAWNSIMY